MPDGPPRLKGWARGGPLPASRAEARRDSKRSGRGAHLWRVYSALQRLGEAPIKLAIARRASR